MLDAIVRSLGISSDRFSFSSNPSDMVNEFNYYIIGNKDVTDITPMAYIFIGNGYLNITILPSLSSGCVSEIFDLKDPEMLKQATNYCSLYFK